MGLFGIRSRESRFWDWFSENSARMRCFESNRDAILEDLGRALDRVHDGLTFEIGPDESPRLLVISADGLVELFPAVEKLVTAAPELSDWKVVAFRQPGDPDAEIEFAGNKLGADDIWFSASQGAGLTDIVLHVRGMDEDNFEAMAGGVFILMDNLLGEYVVGTRVGDIDWDALPADPESHGLEPFVQLREVFRTSGA